MCDSALLACRDSQNPDATSRWKLRWMPLPSQSQACCISAEADVCVVDAEPVATAADALDASSDTLDSGAAGALISAVHCF